MSEPNLYVIIKGLALSIMDCDSRKWVTYFPKAKNHHLKIIIERRFEGDTTLTEYFITGNEAIEIVNVKDGVENFGGCEIDNEWLQNMPRIDEIHGSDAVLTADPQKYAGKLSLNRTKLLLNDTLTPRKLDEFYFNEWEVAQSGNFLRRKLNRRLGDRTFYLSSISKQERELESFSELRIGNSEVFRLHHLEGVTWTVTFDHDCNQNAAGYCEESDFHYYYEIIHPQFDQGRRFELKLKPQLGRGSSGTCGGCVGGVCPT